MPEVVWRLKAAEAQQKNRRPMRIQTTVRLCSRLHDGVGLLLEMRSKSSARGARRWRKDSSRTHRRKKHAREVQARWTLGRLDIACTPCYFRSAMVLPDQRSIERSILRLLERSRGSICPSAVARDVVGRAPEEAWRALMPRVREVAAKMAERGRVTTMQKGKPVDARAVRGPLRIGAVGARADLYRGIDFRAEPHRYRVGRGEEGVLTAEPYKAELLPLWRFKTPQLAKQSVIALWNAFVAYGKNSEFVGMDMARKFLQMGFTRSRRYANHRTGRKYDATGNVAPAEPDAEKAASAEIFYLAWQRAERNSIYRAWRAAQARSIEAARALSKAERTEAKRTSVQRAPPKKVTRSP